MLEISALDEEESLLSKLLGVLDTFLPGRIENSHLLGHLSLSGSWGQSRYSCHTSTFRNRGRVHPGVLVVVVESTFLGTVNFLRAIFRSSSDVSKQL